MASHRAAIWVLPGLLLSACATSTLVQPNPRDLSASAEGDLAGLDLGNDGDSTQDLAGADLLPGPDMARSWTDISVDGGASSFFSVWGSGTGLVYAVGGNQFLYKSIGGAKFNSDNSTKPSSTLNLLSVSSTGNGPPTSPMYVGGAMGLLWAYNGNPSTPGSWVAQTSGFGTKSVYGVWVAPDGTAFAVGDGYAAKSAGAGAWTVLNGIASTDTAYNIWGTPTTTGYSIYAVGYDGTGPTGKIWHSTGGDFTAETSGTSNYLLGVYGFSDTDIYVVGGSGTLLHSTGAGTWTPQLPGSSGDLEGVGGPNANEVYIVGDGGVVLHKYSASSTTWTKEVLPNTMEDRILNAVWGTSTVVYVVGQNGAILKK